MKKFLFLVLLLTSIGARAQTQVSPFQINWPSISGAALPTDYCPTTTTASTTLTSAQIAVTSAVGILPNQPVSGAGIPSGTLVSSVNASTLTVILSQNATATATGVTLTFKSVGMPFTLTSTNPNTQYTCGTSGWFAGSGGGGSGTVTSVALSGSGNLFSSTPGTPVTGSGNLNLDSQLLAQVANCILAGPASGSSVAPTCRSMVAADLPSVGGVSGSYTCTNTTVDSHGRITAASSGSCGGGTGTVGYYPIWLTTTSIGNGNMEEITNSGWITLHKPAAINGSTQAAVVLSVGTGTLPTPLASTYSGWIAPNTGTPAFFSQMPSQAPSAISLYAWSAPSTVNGVSQAVETNYPIQGTDTSILSAGTVSGAAGSTLCNDANQGATTVGCSSGSGALIRIAQVTVSSPTPTITFSSIGGTYSSLKVILYGQSSSGSQDDLLVRFNADTSSDYDYGGGYGYTSTNGGIGATGVNGMHLGSVNSSSATNRASTSDCTFAAYASTAFFKTATCSVWVYNASNPQSWFIGGGWESTAAVTSITYALSSGDNFTVGSVATLYGVQ